MNASQNSSGRSPTPRRPSARCATRAAAADARLGQVRRELADRPADEFDTNGQAKPKTTAAKLNAEATALADPAVPWTERKRTAEQRVRAAVRAAAAHTSANIESIVAEYEPEARQAVADVQTAVETLDDSIVALTKFASRMAPLVSTVAGLDPTQELDSYDGLSRFRRELRRAAANVPLPLPKSIVTPEGEARPASATAEHGSAGSTPTRRYTGTASAISRANGTHSARTPPVRTATPRRARPSISMSSSISTPTDQGGDPRRPAQDRRGLGLGVCTDPQVGGS